MLCFMEILGEAMCLWTQYFDKGCACNPTVWQFWNLSLKNCICWADCCFVSNVYVYTQGGTRNVIPFYHPIKIVTSRYRCCERASECCSSCKTQ